MKHRTKAVLATAAAGVLLLSGGSTLAFWQATGEIPGTGFSTGRLALDASSCDGAGWQVSNPLQGVTDAPFDPAVQTIVPGDTLTKSCAITVVAEGTNLEAELDVTGGEPGGTLVAGQDYTVTGDFTRDGAPLVTVTEADDGSTIEARVVLDFPIGSTVDNSTQDATIDVTAFTVTATQVNA